MTVFKSRHPCANFALAERLKRHSPGAKFSGFQSTRFFGGRFARLFHHRWRQRWWKSRANRPPKNRVDWKPENFAPGECLFKRSANAKLAQGCRDLKTVIEPVPHHEVTVHPR